LENGLDGNSAWGPGLPVNPLLESGADDTRASANFGKSVSGYSDSTAKESYIVTGAPGNQLGRFYFYRTTGNSWFTASPTIWQFFSHSTATVWNDVSELGAAVVIAKGTSGVFAVVSAPDTTISTKTGSGRIFFLQQGTDQKFALVSQSNGYYNLPSPNTNDKLGTSLAASGDSDGHIVAGAPTATSNSGAKGTFVVID
jgi:hypothetical protein